MHNILLFLVASILKIVMPRSKKRDGRSVQFYCLSCRVRRCNNRVFNGKSYPNNTHTCSGLTQHLNADHRCHNYYLRECLVLSNNGYDYHTSLTSGGFGLTNTANGPTNSCTNVSSTCVDLNTILNQQVLYNGLQPHVPRSLIERRLLCCTDNEFLTDEPLVNTDGFDFDFDCDLDNNDEQQPEEPPTKESYTVRISEPLLPPPSTTYCRDSVDESNDKT